MMMLVKSIWNAFLGWLMLQQHRQHWLLLPPPVQQRCKLDTAPNSVHACAGGLKMDLRFCSLYTGEDYPLFSHATAAFCFKPSIADILRPGGA
jgi:hypothetical protein